MSAYKSRWMWVLTGTLIGAALGVGLNYRQHSAPAEVAYAPAGASCEKGIGAAKVHGASAATSVPADTPKTTAVPTPWTPKINRHQAAGTNARWNDLDSWRPILDGNG